MKKGIFCLLAVLLLGGCGYREGVTVTEPAAYLAFSGNTEGAIVRIDDSISFVLGEGTSSMVISDTGENDKRLPGLRYRIVPGKHCIQVGKNGTVVVDRELLLNDGVTREISVP